MSETSDDPRVLLQRALAHDRIHSGYLVSGPGEEPAQAAREFARGLVCSGDPPRPCERCNDCTRSGPREEPALDGTGKKGPLLRHIGDHGELFWVERGESDTRVRIGQVRALQQALRLQARPEGRRAAVIADAEWLNAEAQNALLRLLEEPPPRTAIILVTASSAGLLATVRSRCQKVAFRPALANPLDDPEVAELRSRLAELARLSTPGLLDWAAEYRGARAPAAAGVEQLLLLGSAHLRMAVEAGLSDGAPVQRPLAAFATLAACRKALAQRNANPQMVAERALLALREAAVP